MKAKKPTKEAIAAQDAAEEFEWQKAQLLRRIDMALCAAFEAGRATARVALTAPQPTTKKAPKRAGRK